jgi:hypothetical protein
MLVALAKPSLSQRRLVPAVGGERLPRYLYYNTQADQAGQVDQIDRHLDQAAAGPEPVQPSPVLDIIHMAGIVDGVPVAR